MLGLQNIDEASLLREEGKKVHCLNFDIRFANIYSFQIISFSHSLLHVLWIQILHDILSGKIEECPSLLLRFLVISFADLKNWKVYYKVASPSVFDSKMTLLSLHSASQVLSQEQVMILCT
jgi:ubiquitin-like modifier-activating enzyme ATG7